MQATPLTLFQANYFIRKHHRHHSPVQGHKFSVGALLDGQLVGVAVVGRPVSRGVDELTTMEVTRLCTDGSKDVCSFLYSKCARICREMGYSKIQTYILAEETGTSLRACGWHFETLTAGGEWKRSEGTERLNEQTTPKQRWAKFLGNPNAE